MNSAVTHLSVLHYIECENSSEKLKNHKHVLLMLVIVVLGNYKENISTPGRNYCNSQIKGAYFKEDNKKVK